MPNWSLKEEYSHQIKTLSWTLEKGKKKFDSLSISSFIRELLGFALITVRSDKLRVFFAHERRIRNSCRLEGISDIELRVKFRHGRRENYKSSDSYFNMSWTHSMERILIDFQRCCWRLINLALISIFDIFTRYKLMHQRVNT